MSNFPWFMDLTNIPGSYTILFFAASDFTFITRHIHNWVSYLLCPSRFIPSGDIGNSFPLLPSSTLDIFRPEGLILWYHNFLAFYTVHERWLQILDHTVMRGGYKYVIPPSWEVVQDKLGIGAAASLVLSPLLSLGRQTKVPMSPESSADHRRPGHDHSPPGLCSHRGLTSFWPHHHLSPELNPHARAEGGSFPDQGNEPRRYGAESGHLPLTTGRV